MIRIRFSPRASLPLLAVPLLLLLTASPEALAFCGFYVAQGDAKIYNQSSKVVIARDGDRTVLTMASDFQGDPKEFAVVIPVPVVLKKEQVHIADKGIVDRLHDYSVPRLVEYWDKNPCPSQALRQIITSEDLRSLPVDSYRASVGLKAGVIRIEAQYKVDEYDILILSADEGRALERWLVENGYKIPQGASKVLQSYIRQGMFFFVAKVDLGEQKRLGYTFLRPIQVAYESPKFMLPIPAITRCISSRSTGWKTSVTSRPLITPTTSSSTSLATPAGTRRRNPSRPSARTRNGRRRPRLPRRMGRS